MVYYFLFNTLKHFKPCFFILKDFRAYLLKLKRGKLQDKKVLEAYARTYVCIAELKRPKL